MSFTKAPTSAVITDAVGNTINLGNASGSFTAAPVSIVLTDANGNTLNVGAGVVAKVDLTAQAANIAPTTLYTVPAGQAGFYRFMASTVVTQAATTSSTLPQVLVIWTDNDANVANGVGIVASNSANTLGTVGFQNSTGMAGGVINAKAGTVIQYQVASYASSGATPMQFAVHIKLEYIGS